MLVLHRNKIHKLSMGFAYLVYVTGFLTERN